MGNSNLNAVPGWYEPWEYEIDSWAQLLRALDFIIVQERRFYWRGQSNAAWSLSSALHRHLIKAKSGRSKIVDESELTMHEWMTIAAATMEWRANLDKPWEFFLKMQHNGGKTRLIDVSLSALVAVWFACSDSENSQNDGRLFAFGLNPNTYGTPFEMEGSKSWPFTKHYSDRSETLTEKNSFYVWEPNYDLDHRVGSQQAAVIFGTTPGKYDIYSKTYSKGPKKSDGLWDSNSVLRSTSLHCPMVRHGRVIEAGWDDRAMYVLRIRASAKLEILDRLSKIAKIQDSTLFPNVDGFTRRLNEANNIPSELIIGRNFDLD